MQDKAFVDSNVLVYLYSEDEPQKQMQADDALEKFDCITSVQALNEFSNVCLKKMQMPVEYITEAIDEIAGACTIRLIDQDIIKKALSLHQKYHYSYYDCLMISSSLANDCKYLLSEDMNDGQIIEKNLTIINIFH